MTESFDEQLPEEVARLIRDGMPAAPDPSIASEHLAMVMRELPPAPAPVPAAPGSRVGTVRRRLVYGSVFTGITAKVLGAGVALAAVTGGVTAAGAMPEPLEGPIAATFEVITLGAFPDLDDDEPPAVVEEDGDDDGLRDEAPVTDDDQDNDTSDIDDEDDIDNEDSDDDQDEDLDDDQDDLDDEDDAARDGPDDGDTDDDDQGDDLDDGGEEDSDEIDDEDADDDTTGPDEDNDRDG